MRAQGVYKYIKLKKALKNMHSTIVEPEANMNDGEIDIENIANQNEPEWIWWIVR